MFDISRISKKRLGEFLREEDVVQEEHIQEALDEQEKTGHLLGQTLIDLGYASQEDIAYALCCQFGLPFIEATRYVPNEEALDLVPDLVIKNHLILPIDVFENVLVLVVSDVIDQNRFYQLSNKLDKDLQFVISTRSEIEEVVQDYLNVDLEEDQTSEPTPEIEEEMAETISQPVDESSSPAREESGEKTSEVSTGKQNSPPEDRPPEEETTSHSGSPESVPTEPDESTDGSEQQGFLEKIFGSGEEKNE